LGDIWLPQPVQVWANGAEHSSQNFAVTAFSHWHFGHFIADLGGNIGQMHRKANVAHNGRQGNFLGLYRCNRVQNRWNAMSSTWLKWAGGPTLLVA